MTFEETGVDGVWLIGVDPHVDERGFFARTWDEGEFARRGLDHVLAQCSISHNRVRGTLRGLHFQSAPHEEAKLIRCTAGAIFDVAVDLRPDSPTFTRWIGIDLTAENRAQLYVPRGCAHGFMTLEDGSEVFYQIAGAYAPEFASGVRWNDPAFDISWPIEPVVMNDRDRAYPDFALAS
jgi:dTDP-4-dehydrorhamnose 3,5-epimerase